MPPTAEAGLDRVFTALADPTRRNVLRLLAADPSATASSLAKVLPISRQALTKHLATLEGSQLIERHHGGRAVTFTLSVEPLAATASWMSQLAVSWDERLLALRSEAERH